MFNLCETLTEQENSGFSHHFKSNPNLFMNGIDFNNNSTVNNNHNESRSLSDQPLFDSFFNMDSGMDHLNFNNQEDNANRNDFMRTNNEKIVSKMNTSDSLDPKLLMENNFNASTNSPDSTNLIMPNSNSHNSQHAHYSNFMASIPASYNFVNNHNHQNHLHNHSHQQQPQSTPSFLSSSFTSNSCHNHSQAANASKSTGRFGSNASSLSSNILLSSSSSSFSSFSSNFSNESALFKQQQQQKNLQQQYQNAFTNNQNQDLQQCNTEYQNQLAAVPPPASTLAMHRASLPIAFQSTRTLTDIVSLEHLANSNLYNNHQFSSLDFQTAQDPIICDNSPLALPPTDSPTASTTVSTPFPPSTPTSQLANNSSHSYTCTSSETNLVLTGSTDNSGNTEFTSNGANFSDVQDATKHNLPNFSNQQPQLDFSLSPKTTDLIAMECNNAQAVVTPIVNGNKEQTPTKYAQNTPIYSDNIPIAGMEVNSAGSGNLNNTQISMMIQTAPGFFSRSNSQPDLTQLNCMEKPVPNSSNGYGFNSNGNNSYCCYFNANTANSNGSVYNNNNFNNNNNTNCFNVNATTNNSSNQNFYNNVNFPSSNTNLVDNSFSRQKLLRRHPSLNYKNSMCEYQEEDEPDFLADFNIIDYLNNTNNPQNTNAQSYNINTNSNNNNNNGNFSSLESNDLNSFNVSNNTQAGGVLSNNNTSNDSLGTNVPDDGLFLGTDALTDFLSNCGTLSDLFDDLPEIEDLMSLVTFESNSITSNNNDANAGMNPTLKQTQCDMVLPSYKSATTNSIKDGYPLSNYYDYCHTDGVNNNSEMTENESAERTTRSAPPSPTPQNKKQRPTNNMQMWANKTWNKMDDLERSKAVDCLTRIINDDMGLREQLEIIRILNPDAKLKPTDKQFAIDLKIIDDDKFKRIKDVIKAYGLFANDHQINDNSSDCSANSCPQSYHLAKRELRLKRAEQRLKLKIKKEHRQIIKETKSGLFTKTEVIPLSQVLPEEDIEVDILS